MPMMLDLEPGDVIRVPPNSGALIKVVEKSGRRTRVSVESAVPVELIKRAAAMPQRSPRIERPVRPALVNQERFGDTPAK